MQNKNLKQSGFTIIELLVVISIIALIASMIVVSTHKTLVKARDQKSISEIKTMVQAMDLFYQDNGYYPGLEGEPPQSMVTGIPDGCCGPYLTWSEGLGSYLQPYMQGLSRPASPSSADAFWQGKYVISQAASSPDTSFMTVGDTGCVKVINGYVIMTKLEDPDNSESMLDGGIWGGNYDIWGGDVNLVHLGPDDACPF